MLNRRLVPFLVALMLAACSTGADAPPPLAGAKMGGSFTLTNQDGARISDSAFSGTYRLVYFGYTFCPDVCPVDVARLMKGYAALQSADKAKADKLRPIFISVDPARDTPAALKEFVSAFPTGLTALTGSEAEIADVAKRYGVYFERDKPGAQGGYLVNHSNNAVLYGPKGEPIAIIPHENGPEDVAAELGKWIK